MSVPTAWSRPVTRDPATFARLFALALWTYDTRLPYSRWLDAIGGWADPLGNPASVRVARSMLPPRPTYDGLRAKSAIATAAVKQVAVPDAAKKLTSHAPSGWNAYVVSGEQRVRTSSGTRIAIRQVSVATVCDPTCWLWSATTEPAE